MATSPYGGSAVASSPPSGLNARPRTWVPFVLLKGEPGTGENADGAGPARALAAPTRQHAPTSPPVTPKRRNRRARTTAGDRITVSIHRLPVPIIFEPPGQVLRGARP